jgi:hypothetical protein
VRPLRPASSCGNQHKSIRQACHRRRVCSSRAPLCAPLSRATEERSEMSGATRRRIRANARHRVGKLKRVSPRHRLRRWPNQGSQKRVLGGPDNRSVHPSSASPELDSRGVPFCRKDEMHYQMLDAEGREVEVLVVHEASAPRCPFEA